MISKRLLIVSNIVMLFILCVFSYKFIYPRFTTKEAYSYKENYFYESAVGLYPLYNSQKNVVFLGDSHFAYAHWNEIFGRDDIANRGINGDVTAGMLARIQEVLRLEPKVVFIEAGANDMGNNIAPEVAARNVTTIIKLLKQDQIQPVLINVAYLGAGHSARNVSEINENIKVYNSKIKKISSDEGVAFIDINSKFAKGNYGNSNYLHTDGVHFNRKGYLYLIEEIQKFLPTY